jgi:hypothetical protein
MRRYEIKADAAIFLSLSAESVKSILNGLMLEHYQTVSSCGFEVKPSPPELNCGEEELGGSRL